jgi:hypothetical protein
VETPLDYFRRKLLTQLSLGSPPIAGSFRQLDPRGINRGLSRELALIVLRRFVNPYWLGVETPNGGVMPFFLYCTNYAEVFIGWAPASLGVFWSLAVEEHFYLF